MSRFAGCLLIVLLFAGLAWGQAPAVERLYLSAAPDFQTTAPDFVDIPGSEKMITIPSGTASITWSLSHSAEWTSDPFVFRPVIGDAMPPSGLETESRGWRTHNAGSWVPVTPGGEVTVKLQVAVSPDAVGPLIMYDWNFINWTLIVFPEGGGGVPAVGSIGLSVLGFV